MQNHLDYPLIGLTFDVEWACDEVIADCCRLLDEAKIRATFFCTHAGIQTPGHERALHPNFRSSGDTVQAIRRRQLELTDQELFSQVAGHTREFCPEAVGVRAHSLFYDSQLIPIYSRLGLAYDSSYFLPLVPDIQPHWKELGLVEIPVYYMDHFDLIEQVSGFDVSSLRLDAPGLKVFDFHPNLIYANSGTEEDYAACKPHYHDAPRLLERRRRGPGVRSLLLDLIGQIVDRQLPTATLAEINQAFRESTPRWGNRAGPQLARQGAPS